MIWMPNNKYFQIGYGIIVFLLMVYLATLVDFLFIPIVVIIKTLFLPFFLAGILYYLFRPIVNYLAAKKINKSISILIIYIVLFFLGILLYLIVVPIFQNQINAFADNIPVLMERFIEQIRLLQENQWIANFIDHRDLGLSGKISEYINYTISSLGNFLASFMGILASIILLLTIVPFILFYMLREGEKAPQFVLRLLPKKYRKHEEEAKQILVEMDNALSAYIQGKIILSFLVAVLMYIGYSVIGIEYSLILAVIVLFTNVIPYVGLFIGIIPSLVVAFIDSPSMVIRVFIVFVIVLQVEGNLLTPWVMGKKMDIHPLTIVLLLLLAGSFGGLMGIIIAVPAYAVIKVVIIHMYRLYLCTEPG